MNDQVPCSAFTKTGGLVYFARMLDKIRLHGAGRLRSDYHANLSTGFDGRCCRLLRVEYDAVRERVLARPEDNDDAILVSCYEQSGRELGKEEIFVWNEFMRKRGWRDEDAENVQELEDFKVQSGLAHRTDLLTFFDYYEVDESRLP